MQLDYATGSPEMEWRDFELKHQTMRRNSESRPSS